MQVNGRASRFNPPSGIAAWRPPAAADIRRAGIVGPATAGSRWAAWAHRITARHGAALGRWSWIETILARPRLTLRTTVATFRWPISLTPHAAPRVVFSRETTRIGPPAATLASPRRVPVRLGDTTAPPARLLRIVERWGLVEARRLDVPNVRERRSPGAVFSARPILTRPRESALVARLVARRQRREVQEMSPAATARPAAGGRLWGTESPPPPQTVVARARPAAPPESTPTPLRGMGSPVMDSGASLRPVVPAIDLQGLADQVIRTIDQRVIATRERLGTT